MNHDQSHGMGKHLLVMLICCLVPLGLIMAISVFGLSLGPLQPLLPYVIALMCPLMMIGMMWMMRSNGNEHSQHYTPSQPTNVSPTSLAEANAPTEQKSCH